MISPETFCGELLRGGVSYFVGVPDSLLKNLGSHFASSLTPDEHTIAANEGTAVAMAIGHHLRTGELAAVYLQNSGIGNAVNPLLSLADPEVYGIPMLLIVGWRGEPGVKDEPQHVKQGRVMKALLEAIEVPYTVLPRDQEDALTSVRDALERAVSRQGPVVVLVEKDTFDRPRRGVTVTPLASNLPTREAALKRVIDTLGTDAIVVSTTGMLSRELYEYRVANATEPSDFLTVGGMGHASSIALGVALREPTRQVWCLDGDGALLMHAGALTNVASQAPPTYHHVVFNNGVHDSVGGQPTAICNVDLPALSLAAGYRGALRVNEIDAIPSAVAKMRENGGPTLIEILVKPGARSDLGRPTTTPAENKTAFMENVRSHARALNAD